MKTLFKNIAREQYSQIVNDAVKMLRVRQPNEGWVKTVRMALGMSGAQLSKRLGGARGLTSYIERSELDGKITLHKMKAAAEALGCQFVYAIVPNTSVEDLIEKQGQLKAKELVMQASTQMMLENQSLEKQQLEKEVLRLKEQLTKELKRDFWEPS